MRIAALAMAKVSWVLLIWLAMLSASAQAQPRSARQDDPVQFLRSANDRLQWQLPAEPRGRSL